MLGDELVDSLEALHEQGREACVVNGQVLFLGNLLGPAASDAIKVEGSRPRNHVWGGHDQATGSASTRSRPPFTAQHRPEGRARPLPSSRVLRGDDCSITRPHRQLSLRPVWVCSGDSYSPGIPPPLGQSGPPRSYSKTSRRETIVDVLRFAAI